MSTRLHLHPLAEPDTRARPADPPSPARVETVARDVRAGGYRVRPDQIAAAMLRARDPRARRD